MADARAVADAVEQADPGRLSVVLMPDFYLDHILRFRRVADVMEALRRAGPGGNVDAHPERQMLRPGGGAANVAHALARLGVSAHLVAATSPVGAGFLAATLGRDGVDLSRVRDDGALTVTGAVECEDCSVMLHTPAPHGGFGPEALGPGDWALVERADAVFVGDWANPRAADLAARVWERAAASGARTYTDPGGPQADDTMFEDASAALASPHLHAASLNADELLAHAGVEDDLVEAGRALSSRTRARIDLHANELTASFERGELAGVAPRFRVPARQATGAGDTWGAGSLLGDLLGLEADGRLLLANALAALYVSSERVEPPWRRDVVAFLREARVGAAPRLPA